MISVVLCVGALIGPTMMRATPSTARARGVVLSDDDSLPDSFDLNLLKMPRLTTPEREAHRRYRERQQKQTEQARNPNRQDAAPSGPTPLGMDPVEGDPIDLRAYLEEGEVQPPEATPEQIAEANAAFQELTRDSAPEGFGDGIEDLFK